MIKRADTKEQVEERRKEILDSAERLYSSGSYDDVTIQKIAKMITFARSSIYTYYQNKDEILLDLYEREFFILADELKSKLSRKLSAEDFAKTLANMYLSHENFLRLSSISFTNIENNCSEEKINAFAKNIQPYYNTFFDMVKLSFPNATKEMMNNLSYRITAFLNGIYPLLHQTFKEKNALDNAIKDFKYPDYEEIVNDTILLFLKDLQLWLNLLFGVRIELPPSRQGKTNPNTD